MKNKRFYAVLVLAVGIVLAALHMADLLQWMDASTGFALRGSVWARYLPWLVALALPYLPARQVAAQPTELADTNLPLGCCMLMVGALLLGSGLLAVPTARMIAAYPALYATTPVWTAWADVITPVLAGVWLLVYGWRALTGFGVRRQRLGSALPGLVLPVAFLWRLVWRFQFVPASLGRIPCTLRVLSAVAALLFAVVLLKVFLTPGLPCGHTLFAAGTGCFLLCTCAELPQTLFEACNGMLTLPDLLTGLAMGVFGLCGLACAWAAAGEETE
ncbi:hypothetical protein [uncultured Gemmiger sp.]|uniref:hypothetical protein n=1 Tax=uncultured Gemmiger sp. TaxID=1623490 RepID=UPI0025E9878C|nr:hypothetical protein [uncultured Gemmiger sp.]